MAMSRRMVEQLESLGNTLVDDRLKGVPFGREPFALSDVGTFGWHMPAGDVPFPALSLSRAALDNNIALMQRYCDGLGVSLAPHGKTTMSPQLFARQLLAGAWGMTVATVEQLAVYRRFGIDTIILANQVVGAENLRYVCSVVRDSPELNLHIYVDSIDGARDLSAAAHRANLDRPLSILLEIGYAGGRTGTRNVSDGVQIASLVAADERLRLAGVAGFEGLIALEVRDPELVQNYLDDMVVNVDALVDRGLLDHPFIVSAGGSAAFDMVAKTFSTRWGDRAHVVLRSGCYLSHDHGIYDQTSPLTAEHGARECLAPAIQLWSYVQSRPERNVAYLTFGKRDAGFDAGLPVPLFSIARHSSEKTPLLGHAIEAMNDQHARMRIPAASDLAVGDIVACGISHPCTTFDRWPLIYIIDEADVIVDAVMTFF